MAATVLLGTLLGCSSNAQQLQRINLPSGKQIRVLRVGQINFAKGDSALMLRYETDLKVSNRTALQAEVDEVWSVFRNDVERGSFKAAIISANEIPQGFITKKGRAYYFLYTKSADGSWELDGRRKKVDPPLRGPLGDGEGDG